MQANRRTVMRALALLLALLLIATPVMAEPFIPNPYLWMKAPTVSSVRFSKASVKLGIGSSQKLTKYLLVMPKTAKDRTVTWSSSDESIAMVDENGKVTALRAGRVNITARSVSRPSMKAVCRVQCVHLPIKTITLDAKNAVCDAGNTYTPQVSLKPTNATVPKLIWTSSDEAVASVDEHGKITAHAPGVVMVTAKAAVDSASAKLVLRVRGGSMQVIKLSAIGDVVLGGDKRRVKKADDPIGDGKTSFQRFKALYEAYGAGYFFGKVTDVMNSDSITIANLESVLTTAKTHQNKTLALSGPPNYVEVLTQGGVDVASIANNHANDFYQAGHRDTRRTLKQAGISVVGQGRANTMTKVVDGVTIGFASFQTPANRTEVQAAIRTLKTSKRCSIVVVSFHWASSREWTSNVTSYERSLARFAVNSGADLVLGHHKHFISGIERYKGKMIAYDLGNFVSLIRHIDASGEPVSKDSMIYQQRFHIFEDGYVEVAPPSILPLMNSESLETFTGQPHVVSGVDAERVLEKIRAKTPAASKDLVRTVPGY